jgi:hypothetical protein
MATILDLGKLRFHFAGDWQVATTYEINDVVKYGGNVYVYSSVTRTAGNLPTNAAYWALMVEGFKFRQIYDGATQYRVGDGVAHGGAVYIAIADTQGNTPPNATYWSQFADGIQWEGVYSSAGVYQKNDIVQYGAKTYIAKQDTTGNLPTASTYWDQFVDGISAAGVYNNAINYVPGDLVAYGANIYRCTLETSGNIPTNNGFWELFSTGNSFRGLWGPTTDYYVGETVRFGGNVYSARIDNVGKSPDTNTTEWDLFSTGVNSRGDWITSTAFAINDIVVYGGNTYNCLISHTSGVFNTDLAANKWVKFNSGVRYMGAWTTGTTYLKDDIVSESVSTYIAASDHVAGSDFFVDSGNGLWTSFVVGASYVLPNTAGQAGKYLQTPDGINYSWQFSGANDKIYYVSEDSTSSADDNDHGSAIDYAFASLRFACDYINADVANRTPATIFIKDGTYSEQLPIHIPINTTIVGDGQRNCIIQPDTVNDGGFGAGISDDGVTPNAETTMFFVNSGTMIEGVLLKGLTGFVDNTPSDITASTVKGCYFRIEPGATLLKSPYIKESSAFSTGGVGAIVDGSVVAAGTAGSMVFHTFTQVHNGGIGFWIKDNGLSEIVSCFTYYNTYGYAATGGGKIRALNGNNSYGEYGAVSQGFDTSEFPLSGYVYGDTVEYTVSTLNTTDGFTVGDTITGSQTDSSQSITGISIAQQATVTTTGAHGFSEGEGFAFSSIPETVWQPILGSHGTASMYNRTWYADVVDTTSFRICSNPDLTNYLDTRSLAGWGFVTVAIQDATRSNPVIVTAANHGYSNSQLVQAVTGVAGMTQLNGNDYYAANVTTNTFELYSDAGLTSSVDGTAYTAYTSGGSATRILNGTTLSGGNVLSTKYTANVANIQTNLNPATKHRLVINDIYHGYAGQTFKVTVQNNGLGNRYLFNGQEAQAIKMDTKHRMYIFEQNDITNISHPLYFSTTADGIHAGGAEHTVAKDAAAGLGSGSSVEYWLNGVNVGNLAAYDSGFASATAREVRVIGSVADLYAVCKNHPGMGGGRRFTPTTGTTYGPTTGVMVLEIGAHSLALGSHIILDNESLTFTCAYDGNTTQIAYPKASSAGVFETYISILEVTATTITVNVGVATGAAAASAHSFVSATANAVKPIGARPTIKYETTTQHSTADAFREQVHGMMTYPFAKNTVITAQDGQFATLTNPAGTDEANQGQFGFAMVLGGLSSIPVAGGSLEFITGPVINPADNTDITDDQNTGVDALTYIITSVSNYVKESNDTQGGTVTVTLATEKQNTAATYYGQRFNIRYRYSQVRLTGHDFLSIGTGTKESSNYPGVPTQDAAQGREVTETFPGRVYYVSTDQDGNFRVGSYFRVDQATGRATLDASAFDLAGLTSLRLGSIGAQLGESINEFSSDGSLSGNSNLSVPTEQAVKTYADTKIAKSLLTTQGDIIVRGATAPERLAIGAAGKVLKVNAGGTGFEYGSGGGGAGLTNTFLSSSLTLDADGFVTAGTVGSISYTNIVYETVGRADTGALKFGSFKRIKSYTEADSVAGKTNNVTITYDATSGTVTEIAVVEQ